MQDSIRDTDGNRIEIDGKSSCKALTESDLLNFSQMSREELIKKCIRMKTDLNKAKSDAEFYRNSLIDVLKQHELLKLKYPDIHKSEYNQSWSWVNKIVFVLKKTNRPLQSSEIIALMTPHEPVLEHSHHKAQAFSAQIGKAVKCSRVIAYTLGGSRGYYYVLPEWVTGQGKLMKEYEDRIFFK